MNLMLMALMYPNDMTAELARNVLDKLQNQVNNYQRAIEDGIRQNLCPNEKLSILNSLPVGIYPMQYRKLCIPAGWHDGERMYELGCMNFPPIKQRGRMKRAERMLERWIGESPDNRTVLIYTLYLPYLQAVECVKHRHPDLRVIVIVTDLPNELGLSSGRRGLMKKIEYARGRACISLCNAFDGFVLLTEPMASALAIEDKPRIIIEGIILPANSNEALMDGIDCNEARPVVLYSGTLERDLGIPQLLEAFQAMPDVALWVCGFGSMESEVSAAAERYENIQYMGFVSHREALALQKRATLLINPRPSSGAFTRYSFPSKTVEYMRSGKPVVCHKLEGIPDDYDPYLAYIAGDGAEGIQDAVQKLLSLGEDELRKRGENARAFVLESKNPRVQGGRLMDFLRSL